MAELRDFVMPDLGEGLTEGEIVAWRVAVGDRVAVDQVIAEIATEKATVDVPVPFAGVVAELHGAPGDVVAVGAALVTVDTAAAETAAAAQPGASGNVLVGYGTSSEAPSRRVRQAEESGTGAVARPVTVPSSPLVRRLAAELKVDLASVTGTGPEGMVTRADIERAAVEQAALPVPPAPRQQRVEATDLRRAAAERLGAAHRDIPDASTWVTADATALVALCDLANARQSRVHVTPLAVVLRLCTVALRRFPALNAAYDADRGEAVPGDAVHLGVAVQTDRGLVVPVIRDAQGMQVVDIAVELRRLAGAAREGTLSRAQMSGGSFTVSNFGAFGVDGGIPIVNPPQVAILGVGRIASRPWVVDGVVTARDLVELTLVFDHRACDGAEAGGFARYLADLVEHPDLAITGC